MAKIYRSYLELLKKWPVDATKKERDFAQYLRIRIKKTFRTPELPGDEDEAECWKTYEALNRIADNQHFGEYKRYSTSSASGLTAEQCRSILSEEFIKIVDPKENGLFTFVWKKKH